ncbi:hypothetical protein TL16_g08451 [Triparma laevis f. inornata]|uniref:Uncharacterized protein n=1 Tax=Triparma laevis f. inornata TaxID=1714386 RepID=A0A9W7B5Y3_9STRA|nr:hypothetical protein TL16_g08451 [Triparma laevis f. inornata]
MSDISPFNAANVIKSLRAGGARKRSISSAAPPSSAASAPSQQPAPDVRASLEKLNLAMAASKRDEDTKKAARVRIAGEDRRFDDKELEFYRKIMEDGGGQSPRVNSISTEEEEDVRQAARRGQQQAEKKKKNKQKINPKNLSATQKAALAARSRKEKELGIHAFDDEDSDSSWSDYSDGDDLNFASRRVEKKTKAKLTAENDANYDNSNDNANDNSYDNAYDDDDDDNDDYYSRPTQQQQQQQQQAMQDSDSDDLDDLFGDDMSSGGENTPIGGHDDIGGGGYGESDDEDEMDNEMRESLKVRSEEDRSDDDASLSLLALRTF